MGNFKLYRGSHVEACFCCDKAANIVSLLFWDTWFCSKTCLMEYTEEQLPRLSPTQYMYLIEQQKEIRALAKEFEETPG